MMLLRNRMHPQNIYKNPPNFKELAIHYEEFRKYVKQELSGKLFIDYQDPNAVKALTRTLLKKDFGLDVEIVESRLIPRVPLCLNYVLWVGDLLGCLKCETAPFGVDIGTGCACIYSLLCAKRGWKMLATEVDPENFKFAEKNVRQNNLEGVITVKLVSNSNDLLVGVIDEVTQYDFCMCNPPFFHSNEQPQNRTMRRPQLESVASAVPVEISTEGGEISFISRIIQESQVLKEKIKIYTSLVGKKSDFSYLKKEVQKASPKSVAFTEFCQGRTIRWGLAWSFLDVNLKDTSRPELDKPKKNKPKPPLQFSLPSNKAGSLEVAVNQCQKVLNELKINFKKEAPHLGTILEFKAYENTWSHQRRKKRLKARGDAGEPETSEGEASEGPKAKTIKLDSDSSERTLIVEGLIVLKEVDSSIILEMSWTSGNKEAFHEIFQYFKNYWSRDLTSNG